MSQPYVQPEPVELLAHFRKSLSHGELLASALPDVPEVQLWLVNPSIMEQRLSEDDIAAVFESPAYWSFCWASGQAMARRILDQPELVAGKTVIDFGSGSGVVAIAAVKAGARRVIACDLDPGSLLAVAANAELNGIAANGETLVLSGDCFLAAEAEAEKVDLLLAADVLYDEENKPLLERFLREFGQVLIADSRVKNFNEPGYEFTDVERSITFPDLGEFEEFKSVNFYQNSD